MKKCGIYCFVNLVNGKRYIGQSIDVLLRKRMHLSRLSYGSHKNKHLQSAFKKYGKDNFEFRILEEVAKEMLDVREIAWIEYHKSTLPLFGYNKENGGSFNKLVSDETRAKMSLIAQNRVASPQTRLRQSLIRKGRPLSKIHLKKLRAWGERRKGVPRSLATRQKIKESWKTRPPISDEARKNFSEAQKGKHHSEETKRKMSLAGMGHPGWTKGLVVSDETRRKISEASKGCKHWNYGNHYSEEMRKKLSDAHKNQYFSAETRKKISEANKRGVVSEETCRKISEIKLKNKKGMEQIKQMGLLWKGVKGKNGRKAK